MALLASITWSSAQTDFYSLEVSTLEGETNDLESVKGKKVMVVNTASKCKFSEQYEMLEVLYQKYGDPLIILAFPAGSFGNTEFEETSDIRHFCIKKYEITFRLMEIVILDKDHKSPIYLWLTDQSQNGVMDSEVECNFQKYLFSE